MKRPTPKARQLEEQKIAHEKKIVEGIRLAAKNRREVEVRTLLGHFRVWPDGAITRLDSDGDSIATISPGKPTVLTVHASTQLAQSLKARLESGLFGRTLDEVAERLLCEAVRWPDRTFRT